MGEFSPTDAPSFSIIAPWEYNRHVSQCRLSAVLLVAFAAATLSTRAAETELQEYLVIGTVVWVHPASSSIAIRGASLLGHLRIQERAYRVKQPSALLDLHPGDKITAAFSRKDGMLHRLKRVRSAAKGDFR
jgi:Cu/Ag efflux protein CusF